MTDTLPGRQRNVLWVSIGKRGLRSSTRSQSSRTDDELHIQVIVHHQVGAGEITVSICNDVETPFLWRVRIFVDL